MKNTIAILAAAAGPAAATFGNGGFGLGGGFKGGLDIGAGAGVDLGLGGGFSGGIGFGKKFCNAPTFPAPGNSDNKCEDKWKGGFDWKDLLPGKKFDHYLGFDFKGWSCDEDKDWGKVIIGECGKDRDTAPSFGCGAKSGFDKFSLKEFEVDVEFDCRLEFHYDMPDGSQCKHTSDCFKGKKNKISNTQCGGAKDVKVVYPDQPNKPKKTCKIKVPKIDFDCDNNTPEPPKTPEVPEVPETPETPAVPETPETPETPAVPETPETPETPAVPEIPETPETPAVPETPETPETPAVPETPETPQTTDATVVTPTPGSPSSEVPVVTPTPGTTETSALPSAPSSPVSSPPAASTTPEMTTSTIFTTTVKTITSCAPEVPDCPANATPTGPVVVTQTIAVSTTVCPVSDVPGGNKPTDVPEGNKPTTVAEEKPETPKATKPAETVPDLPDLELPCPDVVPKCMNTFLHKVKDCKDNLDAACFCPDKDFVKEIYECVYAHGKDDDIVSEALQFFQGFCAPYIPKNPAIVTGVEPITSVITVTGTPIVSSIPYTTIVIETTVTEPCVTDGVTITSSSTVKTISTEITVPHVEVPTITRPPVATQTNQLPEVPQTGAPEVPQTGAPEVPAEPTGVFSTVFTTPAVGTGGLPIPIATPPAVPVSGASNFRAGMGLGLVIMAVAAAL